MASLKALSLSASTAFAAALCRTIAFFLGNTGYFATGAIFFGLASAVCVLLNRYAPSSDRWSTVLSICLIPFIFLVPFFLANFIASTVLEIRDGFLDLANSLEAANDQRGFFLYLRSFSAPVQQHPGWMGRDGAMRHMEPMVPGNWPFPYWTGFFDDMSELERALRKVGRLIAIGGEYRPHSFRSTALLMRVPPEDWRKAVQQWATGARAIIYEPGPTQGVVEELQLIADWQLQKKTIILIRSPGNSDLGYLSRTRAAVASAGFELPSLQRTAGVAFLLPEQFSSVSAVTHEIKERWKWKHLRKAILPCLPSGRSWVPLADMLVYQGSASANIRDLCESQTGRTEDQSSETRLG